jgi:hypothetical protein
MPGNNVLKIVIQFKKIFFDGKKQPFDSINQRCLVVQESTLLMKGVISQRG